MGISFKQRKHPKTGKVQWQARYRFVKDGKSHDSRTGWFDTKEEARQDAVNKKAEKERDNSDRDDDLTLFELLGLFIDYQTSLARATTTNNTTTADSIRKRALTLRNLYTPKKIGDLKLSKLTAQDFRRWVKYINDYPSDCILFKEKPTGNGGQPLSGRYVRGFVNTIRVFNTFLLDNDFYRNKNSDFDVMVSAKISSYKLKPKEEGERTDRHELTVDEFYILTRYFVNEGLDSFYNMYWYTLFYVCFFSGIRVEELVGLRWESFFSYNGTMVFDIKNAITEAELRHNVENRLAKGIFRTKNKNSVRYVPLFRTIDTLVEDYKWDFKREFNIKSDEDLNKMFMFPYVDNGHKKFDINRYQSHKGMRGKLQAICQRAGIMKTDMQMFRHDTSGFLTRPYSEGGLGFSPEKVKNLLGHKDSYQIRNTYAKFNKEQRLSQLFETFGEMISRDNAAKNKEAEKMAIEIFYRLLPNGNDPYVYNARKKKLKGQIERAIAKGQDDFEVHTGEAIILHDILKEHIDETKDDYCEHIRIFWVKRSRFENGDDLSAEEKNKLSWVINHVIKVNNRRLLDNALENDHVLKIDKMTRVYAIASIIKDSGGKYDDIEYIIDTKDFDFSDLSKAKRELSEWFIKEHSDKIKIIEN